MQAKPLVWNSARMQNTWQWGQWTETFGYSACLGVDPKRLEENKKLLLACNMSRCWRHGFSDGQKDYESFIQIYFMTASPNFIRRQVIFFCMEGNPCKIGLIWQGFLFSTVRPLVISCFIYQILRFHCNAPSLLKGFGGIYDYYIFAAAWTGSCIEVLTWWC